MNNFVLINKKKKNYLKKFLARNNFKIILWVNTNKNFKKFFLIMCGIFGIIGNNISKNNLDIKKLKKSLSHRGPDFNRSQIY